MPLVLDASALIALMRREPGWQVVSSAMRAAGPDGCFVHALNLVELHYIICRHDGAATAASVLRDIEDLGLKIRRDLNRNFLIQAGELKSKLAGVSLADCIAAVLAARLHAEVITSDPDFNAAASMGVCAVRFIR